MKREINFIDASKKPQGSFEYEHIVKIGTGVCLVAYIVVMIGVFSGFFYLSEKNKSLDEKMLSIESQIKKQVKTESLQIAVKERLKAISWIFNLEKGKPGISTALDQLKDLAGTNKVSIDRIVIDDFGNSIVLGGVVPQVTDLIIFFENLTSEDSPVSSFDNFYVSGLTRSSNGNYKFGLNMEIND